MAVTKIHPIKTTLKKAMDYICNGDKTDDEIYVTTHLCSRENAHKEFELTKKQFNSTNLITVLVNPSFCKEQSIISGNIFFYSCSRTIQFFGKLKGENHSELEIRKWNDHMTNVLGVEIEREFGIKYAKNRMEDAITFVAHKRTVNLPAMYMKSLSYDGENHIKNLLPKYLGGEDTALNAWIMKHVLVGMVREFLIPVVSLMS